MAPADGRVVATGLAPPPPELGLGTEQRWKVSIFLSVLNVHVNRVPVGGVVTRIAYRHGAFVNASLDKASELNERNALAIRLSDGQEIAVVQIAGLIARRILCDVREGDPVRAGQRFGIIRFGSRTDLYLPDRPAPAGRGRPDHDRRRDRHRGDWQLSDRPQVSPIRPLCRSAIARAQRLRPRYKGPSFNRIVPNLMTMLGLCAGLTVDAVRAGGPVRRGGRGDHGRRRHRRAGRPAGPPAEGAPPASAPSSTAWPISSASASRPASCCICGRCRRPGPTATCPA